MGRVTGDLLVARDITEQASVLQGALVANGDAIERARSVIAGARVVRLVGIGSSRHAAGYGALALDVLGGTPATVLPAPGEAVAIPAFDAHAPVIVLSQSGETPSLVAASRDARAAGAPIICVTNSSRSPLESLATVTLHCAVGDERVVAATKSVTAQMVLLRALAAPFDASSLTDAVVAALAVDVESSLGAETPVAVVCSGFAAEWVADEIALKLAEMAGLAIAAEPLVEHLHGPIAASGSALAFVDGDDPNADALGSDDVVRVPLPPTTGDSSLDAVATLVVGQRVALAWALRLGEDPDAPRGLNKVTATR